MTMRESQNDTMNKLDPTPSVKAADVVIAATRAAWLDGIPPVRHANATNTSRAPFLCELNKTIIALISCAKNQLVMEERKIGFSKNDFNDNVLIGY
jgi:hypothetical protein